MNIEQGPKKEALFTEVSLKLQEPVMGHNWEIFFDAKTEKQCVAYNRAVREIGKKYGLHTFHQTGSDNKTGYQSHEIWRETSREELEKFFPEIHSAAEKYFRQSTLQ